MSTTARRYWLKLLHAAGVRNFRAKSGLGLSYICHVGDFAGELPFYSRSHSAAEIILMAAWCRGIEKPVIFDVGANNGFISTQLAQLLRPERPKIFAFEPVPSTFAQLALSTDRLRLNQSVIPICCALSDRAGMCEIAYNPRESLFAQVREGDQNPRDGTSLAIASTMKIDEVVRAVGKPALLKIDVEGSEGKVLQGAVDLLSKEKPPAICFEWNPVTLSEARTSPTQMVESLSEYYLHYVDDFEGGKEPFGKEISDLTDISWVCNVFAVPIDAADRWCSTIVDAQEALTSLR